MLVAMHLEDLLNELGHRVAGTATRVERAVELARTARIDLAILDINLSGATSFPVAAILRERNIRFFFVTGYGFDGLELPDGNRAAEADQSGRPKDDPGANSALIGRRWSFLHERGWTDQVSVPMMRRCVESYRHAVRQITLVQSVAFMMVGTPLLARCSHSACQSRVPLSTQLSRFWSAWPSLA